MAEMIICMFIACAFASIIGYDLFCGFKKNNRKKSFVFKKIIKYRGYDISILVKQSECSYDTRANLLFNISWNVKYGYGSYTTNIKVDEVEQAVQTFIKDGKECIDTLMQISLQIKKLKKIIDNL
jgi:hypothetical protein